ncbi:hypothetical protein F5Y15DRAFT_428518 [Xylariaceae sp. FL0016]|nr:hypothetical protein F5Y15DRAFT_428518 [Xylariaceae sp. FL0016]
MTFTKIPHSNSDPGDQKRRLERPRFNSLLTSDRLREGQSLPPVSMVSSIRKGRKSIFKEMGLDEMDDAEMDQRKPSTIFDEKEFGELTGLTSSPPTSPIDRQDSAGGDSSKSRIKTSWLSRLAPSRRPHIRTAASAPPPSTAGLHRLTLIALLIAVVLPTISYNNGRRKVEISGADAGVIRQPVSVILDSRANSPTDVCQRWAGQSAVLNGTLFYYGGRSKTSEDQSSNEWNNDFVTLDLTKSWDISSPALTGLAQPSGPPAVSLGYLWNDLDHLFLYGGEFSDNPVEKPTTVSTWQYDIASASWSEFQNPQTSAGNFSDAAGVAVQRAAEGAGVSVPELGVSWYFGGHLDYLTTPGWSDTVERVYLKSLLEFTHPGYANSGVDDLHASAAPDGGAYRNITWSGTQNQDGFTERADGVLVFVPGWGPNGILLGLGGGVVEDNGTTDAYASMTTIDVYDIKSSTWYHQETSGEAPQVRVNPCAVIFSAPDASSFNIYMYGGQNLLPTGDQIQYTDIWILTIPSFTWIKVDTSTSNEPPARAGHACAARDGQMVVFGGYIDPTTKCENPGIYNFDASDLQWKSSFSAADHPADDNADNTVLAGSYGYQVPDAVQSVVGGSSDGGATATQPASGPATDGPFKTGTAPVFTITAAGSTATVSSGGNGSGPVSTSNSGASPGTIAAGVIAGLAGLIACYLGFCAWLWRRQVRAYRRHMAVANRAYPPSENSDGEGAGANALSAFPPTHAPGTLAAGLAAAGVRDSSSREKATSRERERLRKHHQRGSSSGGGGNSDAEDREHFAWVGQLGEPKWMTNSSEDPSPGSGTGSGATSRPRPSEERNQLSYVGAGYGGGYDGYYSGGGGNAGNGGVWRNKSDATRSTASGGSAEALLDGRTPNFFSVVLGPRRALRVVNGMED